MHEKKKKKERKNPHLAQLWRSSHAWVYDFRCARTHTHTHCRTLVVEAPHPFFYDKTNVSDRPDTLIPHLWKKAEGRTAQPSGRLLCVLCVRARVCVWEWMETLMSSGKCLFVQASQTPALRNNFLMADVFYNQHLIALHQGSAGVSDVT